MAHEHCRTKRLLVLVLFLLAGCGGGPGAGSPGGSPDGAQNDASSDAAPVDTTADLDAPQEVSPDAAPEQVGTDGLSPEDLPPLPDTLETVEPVPVVTIDTPQPGFVRGTVEVTVTATGDPEVVKVRFLVDGGLLFEDDTVPYGAIWETTEFDDGDHEIAAVAFDAAGQTAEASVVVTVDNTPPDVSFLSPEPGVIQHDEVLLSVDATDNFQVDHVEFWVDSGGDAVEISEPPWELLYDGSALEAGLHTAFVSAVDAAGNETGMFMTFPVDRPPLVGFLVPALGAVVTGPTAVQAEAWDDLSLGSVALFVDGEWEAALATAGGDTYAADWIPTYEKGERLLSVIAVDSEGQETAAAVTVMVDHPVAVALQLCQGEVCSPLQAETELTGIVQLRATATDDGAAIVGVDFLVDGVPAHQDLEAPYDFPWDTAGVADGARLLEALATNALDEIGAVLVQVQVNNCDLDDDDYAATGCGGPDCDDGDAGVNPSASDLVGNDADENCDGMDGVDADGDDHASAASGGDDCDDEDPLAYPCGDDLPGDGVDGNCDGADALSCDDCEPCTADGFVGGLCIHGPYPDGAPCDDGDLCTAPGTCQDQLCPVGPLVDCDDGDPCTEDGCAPETGCHHLPLDGTPCGAGTCQQGICCVPACGGKECGPDSCGGFCGGCPCDGCGESETVCSEEGICVLPSDGDLAELGIRILGPDAQGWGQFLAGQVSVTGMAVGGPEEILWETDQGASGSVLPGGLFWATGAVPLVQGDNVVTVIAVKGQETASDTLVLTYNPAFMFGAKLDIRPGGLFVGEASTLVFRVGMGTYTNFTPSTLTLCECTADGEWLADVHVMKDDGQVSNSGDEIQQDGVYSWRKGVSPDATGTLCFRVHALVTAGYQQYDALSPVSCVEVVEHVTPAQCEAAKALHQEAKTLYDSAMGISGDPADARLAVLSWLEGADGVVASGPASDGGYGIWLRHDSGILGSLALSPEGLRGGGDGEPGPLDGPGFGGPEVRLGSRRAAALSPYHSEFGATDESLGIQTMLEQSSCPSYPSDGPLLDGQAGLAAWRRLSDHGLVAVATHGEALFMGLDDAIKASLGWHHQGSQELLWTGEEIDGAALLQGPQTCSAPSDCPPGTECVITQSTGFGPSVGGTCVDRTQRDLARGRIAMGTDRYAILPSFIERYQGQGYPDSLVYLGACRSMYNGSLGMEFFAAGARAIAGYTGYITSGFAFDQGTEFFTGLIQEHVLSGEAMPPGQEDPDNPGSGLYLLGAGNLNVYHPEIIDSSWESGELTSWLSNGDARVVSRLGGTVPIEGKYMALISTGTGYTPQCGEISQDFCIPAGKNELSFYWKFFSEEFKEWCGSSFQDTFQATLESETGQITVVDIWVDALCPPGECYNCGSQYVELSQADVSFDQGGVWATSWRKAIVDVSGFIGQPVTLRFTVTDAGDSIYDSVVLIDAVKFK
ncbi:MAG: Ig-like domain-containing protein [Pseudomonadota bacterium]